MSRLWNSRLQLTALIILIMGSLLALSSFAVAQTVSGTISGTAVDPSSLPIADATVILTNSDSGVKALQKTRASGEFTFTAVLSGRYSVAIEMKGFKKVEKTDLHITAAERLSAGEFVLQVGEVTESVTVDAAGTPVQVNVPGANIQALFFSFNPYGHILQDLNDAVANGLAAASLAPARQCAGG